MTCCAAGPCDRFLAGHRRADACRLCWWGEQAQPETLLAKIARLEEERRMKALGVDTMWSKP